MYSPVYFSLPDSRHTARGLSPALTAVILRSVKSVDAMRCSEVAEEEICHVFSRVAKMIKDIEPLMFGDFHQDENGYWCPKYVKV